MEKRREAPAVLKAAVVVAVVLAFLPALRGGLVWDDVDYVRTNDSIRSLEAARVVDILGSFQQGNYHPLTILSLAFNYALGGLEPSGYHLLNLLLHAGNVWLVFLLARGISRRDDAALAAAAFWGLHPLRVESVAWISGRKDLLYTGFFLVALLAYRRWVERGSVRSYLLSIGSYVLSLLSKGMAVSFALVPPLSDFVDGRKTTRRSLLEKVPFFALSLAFGWLALVAQRQAGGTKEMGLTFPERLAVAAHGLVAYLGKTLWPFDLSALYPYPSPAGGLPLSYTLAPLAVIGLAIAVALSLRRTRKIAFGFLFYLATVVFVLQVLPVGVAVLADRYTYLSTVGLSILAGEGFARSLDLKRGTAAGRAILVAGLAVLAALGALTWRRSEVWHDNATLWADVLSKSPDSAIAHNNRGNALADAGDRAGAARDYAEAIRLDPGFVQARYNDAYLAGEMGDFARAADGLSRVLDLAPDMVPARLNRADAYERIGRPRDAVADYDRALALAPDLAPAYAGRARARLTLGDRAGAFADARRAQALGFPLDPDLVRKLNEAAEGP